MYLNVSLSESIRLDGRGLFLKSLNVPRKDLDGFVSNDSLCVKLM